MDFGVKVLSHISALADALGRNMVVKIRCLYVYQSFIDRYYTVMSAKAPKRFVL